MIDLFSDFAQSCARELRIAGYDPPLGASSDSIRAYANVRHRRVPIRPRKVHKAAYSVPSHLTEKEKSFLAAVTEGADLRPYQSTKLERHDFNDGMLNDFGIHHFHLGIDPHPTKVGFKERSDPVLFAIVREEDFYVLGCFPHRAWHQQSLLDVAYSNWPILFASVVPNDAQMQLSYSPTDADIKKLRKHYINTLTKRPEGTVTFSLGGGLASDNGSAMVTRDINGIKRLCIKWERIVNEEIAKLKESGELSAPVTLRLDQRGSEAFVVGPRRCQ